LALQRYNHTIKLLLEQSVNLGALKLMLLNSSAAFNAAHTALTQVTNAGAYEVSGAGWDAGGEILTPAFSIINTDGAMMDFSDLSVTAVGGTIGPAYAALIHDGTYPLWFETFPSAQDAGDGTPMNVSFNENGIMRVNDA
jgi:hypothetical protein